MIATEISYKYLMIHKASGAGDIATIVTRLKTGLHACQRKYQQKYRAPVGTQIRLSDVTVSLKGEVLVGK